MRRGIRLVAFFCSWCWALCAAASIDTTSAQRLAEGDPEACRHAVEETLQRLHDRKALRSELEWAHSRCHEGYGIGSALAELALGDARYPDAVELLQAELTAPHPAASAVPLALELMSKAPPEQRERLAQTGTDRAHPLHVHDIRVESEWEGGVLCPSGVRSQRDRLLPGDLVSVELQCVEGRARNIYVALEEFPSAPAAEAPAASSSHTAYVDALIPYLVRRFGIQSASDLRTQVEGIGAHPSRSDAWLLAWVGDLPGENAIWASLHADDPDDLEATIQLANGLWQLGRDEEALDVVSHADPKRAVIRDTRGMSPLQPSGIVSLRARLLWERGDMAGTLAASRQSLALGSRFNARYFSAKVALARGDVDTAARELDAAMRAGSADVEIRFLHGVVLAALDQPVAARAEFERCVEQMPTFTPAHLALAGKKLSFAEWDAVQRTGEPHYVARGLARCGHIYAELGMTERAERCFAMADQRAPGFAAAARLAHQGETNLSGAIEAAKAAAAHAPSAPVLGELAVLEQKFGEDPAAVRDARKALELDPGEDPARKVLVSVCRVDKLDSCSAPVVP